MKTFPKYNGLIVGMTVKGNIKKFIKHFSETFCENKVWNHF